MTRFKIKLKPEIASQTFLQEAFKNNLRLVGVKIISTTQDEIVVEIDATMVERVQSMPEVAQIRELKLPLVNAGNEQSNNAAVAAEKSNTHGKNKVPHKHPKKKSAVSVKKNVWQKRIVWGGGVLLVGLLFVIWRNRDAIFNQNQRK